MSSFLATRAVNNTVARVLKALETQPKHTMVYDWVWVARLTPQEFPAEITPLLTMLSDAGVVLCDISLGQKIVITLGYAHSVTGMTADEMLNCVNTWRSHEREVIERIKLREARCQTLQLAAKK